MAGLNDHYSWYTSQFIKHFPNFVRQAGWIILSHFREWEAGAQWREWTCPGLCTRVSRRVRTGTLNTDPVVPISAMSRKLFAAPDLFWPQWVSCWVVRRSLFWNENNSVKQPVLPVLSGRTRGSPIYRTRQVCQEAQLTYFQGGNFWGPTHKIPNDSKSVRESEVSSTA